MCEGKAPVDVLVIDRVARVPTPKLELEPVVRGGFCCWSLVQRGQKTLAAAVSGHLLCGVQPGKLFGQGGRHDPLHGNLLPRSRELSR